VAYTLFVFCLKRKRTLFRQIIIVIIIIIIIIIIYCTLTKNSTTAIEA